MNGKTIKQIAAELNVSKPTVTKAIEQCGLGDHLTRVGNRYELTEEQEQLVKSKILQIVELPKATETQNTANLEMPKSKTETQISENKTKNKQNSEISIEERMQNPIISLLQVQLELLQQQLAAKDEQLATKDRQIEELTRLLEASQEQQTSLVAALAASQALHAGTIQERLTIQADTSEEPVQEHCGFFSKMFGKKNKK